MSSLAQDAHTHTRAHTRTHAHTHKHTHTHTHTHTDAHARTPCSDQVMAKTKPTPHIESGLISAFTAAAITLSAVSGVCK